jgi:adhesin/invasin
MDKDGGGLRMRSRASIGLVLGIAMLVSLGLWLGCERKGDIVPSSTGPGELLYFDSVRVSRQSLAPSEQLEIDAHVLSEAGHNGVGVAVRFSANKGYFLGTDMDTTVSTDSDGWARATYVAPEDTGTVTLRAELISMEEQVTYPIYVTSTGQPLEGQLYLWVDADTLFADNGLSSVPVHARLRNSSNNPIGGAIISFSTTQGTIQSPITTDSATGVATTALYSGVTPGVARVRASYGAVRDSVDVVFVEPYPAASIVVNAMPQQITAGVDSSRIRAVVYDAQGQPVADNTLVIFTTDHGTLSYAQRRTVSGVVTTTLYAPPSTGVARVTANCGAGVNAYADVDITPGPLALILLVPESDSLYADNSSTTPIDVYAKDAFGNAANEGTPISFVAYGGSITPSATVDEAGYVQVTFQAGLAAGPAAVIASNGSVQSSVSIYLMPTPAASISLSVSPAQILADGSSTANLTALVLDEESRPVSDGTIVTFRASLGVLGGGGEAVSGTGWGAAMKLQGNSVGKMSRAHSSGSSRMSRGPRQVGGAPTQSVYTATTQSGYAHAILTSSTTAGVDTVVASLNELSDEQHVTFTAGSAALVSIEAAEDILPADGISSTQLTIRVHDQFGNSVGAGTGVSVETSLGSVFPEQGHTNAQGEFSSQLLTGRTTGIAALTAQSGSAVGYGEVEFVAPNVAVVAVEASATSILADGVSTALLIAYVADANEVPIYGQRVSWEAGTGIGEVYPAYSVTDSAGFAQAIFRSGASVQDASQQATARVGTYSDDVVIAMRGVSVSVTAQDEAIPANGQSTTEIHAQVRETTSFIGVAGVNVAFATTLGSIPAVAVTNSSGVATAALTAAPTVGTATITASYGDTLSASTQVRMISTSGNSVMLTAGSPTLLGDGLSSTPLQAYVEDEQGTPVAGEQVTFAIQSGVGGVAPPVAMTGSDGYASSVYVAGAVVRDTVTTVQASISNGTSTTAISLRGITIYCVGSPATIVADGHSTAMIQVHLFETTRMIAISHAEIYFGTSLGTIPNESETNFSGLAVVTLTSGTIPGNALVIARYGNELADSTQITFAVSEPTHIQVTANPTTILADNVSTSTITVNVTDQGGNPVPDGTQIHFYIPPNSGSIENLRTTTNGVATNVLTSSVVPDTVGLLVWAEQDPSVRDSVRVTYVVGTPAIVQLTAQTDTLKADGISVDTVCATVMDVVGHRLSNVEVTFDATIGSISHSRTTGGNGVACVPFSSPVTGIATITATAGTGEAYFTVYLVPGCPWSIQMDYNPHSVGVRESGRNETLLITATVKDASNNRVVDGTPVYFDIYSQPITDPDSMGSLSSVDSIPTINGQANVSYTSGYRSGTVRIRARSYGVCEGEPYNVSAVTTEILIFAGPPYIEDIYNPDGCGYFNTSHLKVMTSPCDLVGWSAVGDSVRIIAIVGDKWNNPVTEGTAVYFTTSGGVISTATGYTDANGFASVTLFGGNPMPTLNRWRNTLQDPNLGGPFNCWGDPMRDGYAKVLATSEGVTENNQSAIVWASCDVRFTAPYDNIEILEVTVNGDPEERTMYIGQNALITFWLWEGGNNWPIDSESEVHLSASAGMTYPNQFTIGCPGDTLYTMSFFNNLTTQDDATSTPVLIEVESKNGNLWAFTETFLLLPQMPPTMPPGGEGEGHAER